MNKIFIETTTDLLTEVELSVDINGFCFSKLGKTLPITSSCMPLLSHITVGHLSIGKQFTQCEGVPALLRTIVTPVKLPRRKVVDTNH